MIRNYIENANFEDTGFHYTLSLISGKHKMVILYCLMEFQVVRFNELKRYLKNISDKTLSTNLKELEADALIVRTEYPQIPPKVEYTLSERGKSLMAVSGARTTDPKPDFLPFSGLSEVWELDKGFPDFAPYTFHTNYGILNPD